MDANAGSIGLGTVDLQTTIRNDGLLFIEVLALASGLLVIFSVVKLIQANKQKNLLNQRKWKKWLAVSIITMLVFSLASSIFIFRSSDSGGMNVTAF